MENGLEGVKNESRYQWKTLIVIQVKGNCWEYNKCHSCVWGRSVISGSRGGCWACRTGWLWRRVLAGARLGWLAGLCRPSSKREHKKGGKVWRGQRQPRVLLGWVFSDHRGHLGNDAQLVVSRSHLTPICLSLWSHLYALLQWDLRTFAKLTFFHSVQWVLGLPGQQDIYNVSPVCQVPLHPSLTPLPSPGLLSPQNLSLMSFSQGSLP